jgi:hypothetical protein
MRNSGAFPRSARRTQRRSWYRRAASLLGRRLPTLRRHDRRRTHGGLFAGAILFESLGRAHGGLRFRLGMGTEVGRSVLERQLVTVLLLRVSYICGAIQSLRSGTCEARSTPRLCQSVRTGNASVHHANRSCHHNLPWREMALLPSRDESGRPYCSRCGCHQQIDCEFTHATDSESSTGHQMIQTWSLALLSTVLTLTGCASTRAGGPTHVAPVGAQTADGVQCRMQRITGTLVPTRVCTTRAEREAEQRRAQGVQDSLTRSPSALCPAGVNCAGH